MMHLKLRLSSNQSENIDNKISFELFMDMIYNVDTMEPGINDLLQLIEIVLGEGKEFYQK